MYIGAEAAKIVRLILRRANDERLKWYADGRVRIHIGKIVPDETGDIHTLVHHRKQFRRAVRDRLRGAGWQPAGLNVYQPPTGRKDGPQEAAAEPSKLSARGSIRLSNAAGLGS